MYEIEKGVPTPEQRTKKIKYPFRTMDIGDSFFVPVTGCDVTDLKYAANKVTTAASGYAKRDKTVKFTVRTVDGGVRCWRIK